MVDSISSTALQGLNEARMKMQKNASDIASAGTGTNKNVNANLATSLVEINQNKQVAEANIKVIKTENDMLGSLLDIKA